MKDNLRIGKGPVTVLQALASGDEDDLREALAFQRESFRAQFGCYPEELIPADEPEPDMPASTVPWAA